MDGRSQSSVSNGAFAMRARLLLPLMMPPLLTVMMLMLIAPAAECTETVPYDINMCLLCCERGNTQCPPGCPPCLLASRGQCPYINRLVCCRCPIERYDCDSDSDCSGGQRCCIGSCSRRCTDVCLPPCAGGQRCERSPGLLAGYRCVGTPQPPLECDDCKPGQCPRQVCFGPGGEDLCTKDADCPGGERCCRYCRGRSCVPPCLPGCPAGQQCELDVGLTCRGPNCPSYKQPRHKCV